jgi:hypothetical protein
LSGGSGALPGRLRLASLLSVLLSGLCGLFSAWDGFALVRIAELKQAPPPFQLHPDPVLAEQLRASQVLALEQMREPRMVVLFALALACSLSFVASTRLLRPAGLPREGVRRILVWALVVAAVLRTIDGAQATVVVRTTAEVLRRGLTLPDTLSGASAEEVRGLVAPAALLVAIFQTVVMVGPFLLLSQYFRSPRVKEWAMHADAHLS